MTDHELESFLSDNRISMIRLSKTKKRMLQRSWRKVFAVPTYEKTGRWRYRGYDWHSFSYEFHPHLEGRTAIREYMKNKADIFFIVPEDESLHGYVCQGKRLPDLSGMCQDFYVFPTDLSWTMVFTHEQPELGPYYTQATKKVLQNISMELSAQ